MLPGYLIYKFMSNILSFEKFAEFQPIEGLLDGMKNMRLFGEVRSAVVHIERATASIPELPVVSPEIQTDVTDKENSNQATDVAQEDVTPTTPMSPEVISHVSALEAAREEIASIHAAANLEFEIPDELKAA